MIGEKPSAADIQKMLGTLPKFAKQLPTMSNIDLSKVAQLSVLSSPLIRFRWNLRPRRR